MRRLGSVLTCLALTGPAVAGCGSGATDPGAPVRVVARSAVPSPGEPTVAGPAGAREVARQLTVAERAIARRTTAGLARAGRAQQVAYRSWSGHPAWDRRVLAALPRALRPRARANVTARRLFRSMHPAAELSSDLPAWKIVRPWRRARLLRAYREGQRRYGVGWSYLAAVNMTETAFGRIVGLSSAGAQGPMQFMPATWAAYGHGDVHDPHDAILGAAHYLAANGFRRSPSVALWHYNHSTAYVRGVRLLASVMGAHPREFAGYHAWQVYYLTRLGSVLLPQGYAERRPVPVRTWLREHHATFAP